MSKNLPIIIVLILILLLVGGYFLWWPQYQEFKDLKFQLEKKTERLTLQEEYFTELDGLLEQLRRYETELSRIDSALPTDVDFAVIGFFNFIQKRAPESGLILKDINLEKAVPPEISFNISVLGSYSALKNFLKEVLYKNIRMIKVESISFSEPEGGEFFTFDLRLTARIFSEIIEEGLSGNGAVE